MRISKKKNLKLGNTVKKLEFKILKVSKNRNIPHYHIVVSRKRTKESSRLDKVGFFHFAKKKTSSIKLMGLNMEKIKFYASRCVVP